MVYPWFHNHEAVNIGGGGWDDAGYRTQEQPCALFSCLACIIGGLISLATVANDFSSFDINRFPPVLDG